MARIYFLNVGFGDTTIIKSNSETFIIDCNNNITEYENLLPSKKNIKALFITHQHYDHFLGMEYLKEENYFIDYIICSPYVRRYGDYSIDIDEWNKFKYLMKYFENKGTKIYKPYRQVNFDKPWWEIHNLKIWIIGPDVSIAKNDKRGLHDASLVFVIKNSFSNRKCCFTGDASDKNLNFISSNTKNYCDDILHASHHGSIEGADLEFIKKANIKHTIISTKSGIYENVPHPTALQRYRNNTIIDTLRTDVQGTIEWIF